MAQSKSLADWVKDLIDPEAREMALLELSKQREKFPELAPFLWNSFGTMAVLLQVCLSVPRYA
jgi:CCR4-NOT transcription complex subunit 9